MRIFRKNYSEDSDEELMQKIRQGNAGAFDELYHRYSKRLLLYFYRMLGGDSEKTQDFLQDLFLKIVEKNNLFRNEARFSTWIFTVAHNMCKNEYRRLSVRKIIDHQAEPDDVFSQNGNDFLDIEQKIDEDMFKQIVLKELGRLDENQCSTFILRFQENLSIKEISQILGCSDGTTKSRLFYVTQKLSKRLKRFNPRNNEVPKHEGK
jgi:RNA polymerase sigma-70 factor (ECF subfamily)